MRALAAQSGGLAQLMEASGMQSSAMYDTLSGKSKPRKEARIALAQLAETMPEISQRRCVGCGEAFDALEPRQQYCSTRCRERGKKQRQRERWHLGPASSIALTISADA